MTPEVFFKNLDLTAIVRKSTEKEKPVKLEEGDAEKLCSIVEMDTPESCLVLHEVYEKYKALGYYPKELLQAVYFVIYRDCRKLYVKEKEAYKTAPDENYKILGKNGLVQGEKRVGITTEVFKRVIGGNSKIQEKWGMSPFDDFMSNIYDPVDMFSLKMRGDLFRRIIVRVLQERFCSMLIDLSGDVTLFEDIYPQKREIMLVSNSNIGDFYYVIKNEFNEFCKTLDLYMKDEVIEQDAMLESLKETAKYTKADLYDMLPENVRLDLECEESSEEDKKDYIFSYPYQYEGDMVVRAVQYFLTVVDIKELNDIDTTKKKLKALGERLSKTTVVCGTINSLLEGITKKEISLLDFEDTIKGKISDTDIEKSIRVLKEGHFEELEKMKNVSPRRKKGLLFYDYTVRRNIQDLVSFANFVNTHDCFWMTVCNKDDILVRELFKGEGRYSYELNTDGVFKNFFFSDDYFNEVSVKKVLITNILAGTKVDDDRVLFIPEVEQSPIFSDLERAFKNSNVGKNDYTKILVRETTEEAPDYVDIIEQLEEEE